VYADLRRRIGGDVKIASRKFEQLLQQVAEGYRHSISFNQAPPAEYEHSTAEN
jgi:hypothetical protein